MSLIVPAAGCGARAAQNGNKILAPLRGRPLLFHTLRHLLTRAGSDHNHPSPDPYAAPAEAGTSVTGPSVTGPSVTGPTCSLDELIIAARREEWPLIQAVWDDLARQLATLPVYRLVEGGASRQDSVLAAVRAAGCDFVAVHDAARPFASRDLLDRVWRGALPTGAAIAALPASDTVKRAISKTPGDGAQPCVCETLERGEVWLAQTPQVFRRELLLEALETARREGWAGTDCASAVERLRNASGAMRAPVALVESDAVNFKVTFPTDLTRAAWTLEQLAADGEGSVLV